MIRIRRRFSILIYAASQGYSLSGWLASDDTDKPLKGSGSWMNRGQLVGHPEIAPDAIQDRTARHLR
jgi:hypothetical protein